MLNVKAEQVATFLGRQITPLPAQEIGSQFSTRIEGTCINHQTPLLSGPSPLSDVLADVASIL